VVGLAMVAVGVIFVVVEPRFRILADETNLLSTSYSLFLNQEFLNIKEKLFYYGIEHVISSELPHRPALYSVLLSLLHTSLGYQWYQGFVLNFLVGVASLLLFYHFGRVVAGRFFGLLCALLLASFPVFQLNITSSGFDALNLLMLALTYALLYRFLFKPSGQSLELLLLVTILGAQARYESMALLVPVAGVMLWHWRQMPAWQYSVFFPVIPLLAIPVLWQKIVSSEFSNNANDAATAFAMERILPNLGHLAEFLFDWHGRGFATQPVVVALAVIGLFWGGWQIWRTREPRLLGFILAFSVGYLMILLAHLSYQYGDMRLAWIYRLTHIHLLWIIPAAAFAIVRLHHLLREPALLAGLLVVLWISGISAAYRDPIGKTLQLQRQFATVSGYLIDHYPPQSTLVISDARPNMYAALGYSSLRSDYANRHIDALRTNLQRGLFERMLYLEDHQYAPAASARLDSAFAREELFRTQYKANGSVIIHQVEAIR
jgi:hypothetical protein